MGGGADVGAHTFSKDFSLKTQWYDCRNPVRNWDRQTNRQTDRQTDIWWVIRLHPIIEELLSLRRFSLLCLYLQLLIIFYSYIIIIIIKVYWQFEFLECLSPSAPIFVSSRDVTQYLHRAEPNFLLVGQHWYVYRRTTLMSSSLLHQ